ncbi:MAG: VWA domain-containing protein [Verrucomicrobia bacterium]|nr:VWA domain-containing protein [Verrucomicrobiota bacterium]
MHFESPWALALLAVIPFLLGQQRRGKRTGAIRFSSTAHAARAGRSLRQRLHWLPQLLRVLALVALVVALARPQEGLEGTRDISQGIAIQMVVDRSSSMSAEMEYGGRNRNRLEVVKELFHDFVLGDRKGLAGRPNDLIGMIAFARYADTVAPLSLAHGALPRFLDTVKLVQRREEDGTAIGDALALAAARLHTAEATLAQQLPDQADRYELKSKIVILLTDGQNNAGQREPLQAAQLAKEWGIKIYTIGVGGGEAVTTVQTLFGPYKVPLGPGVDERGLAAIAEATGGIYRRADSAQALKSVYEEIDQLERSEIEAVRYLDYRERFVGFALFGLLCLLGEVVAAGTVFRKIP